jgi:predicted kinase
MDLERLHPLDVVVVAGLPGSGKSHFAGQFFRDQDRLRVNRKEIRSALYEMMHFGSPWSEREFDAHDEFLVKHVERKIIEHLLQNRKKVLVDTVSVTAESRRHYVALAQQMHRSIGIVFLDTPTAHCRERNAKREDPVPDTAISNLAAALEPPQKGEGFREVMIVHGY